MTLTDKDKLIRELRINPAGCEECEYADSKLNCTRGFQFASACESICEAREIDEEEIVKNYCKKYNINQIRVGEREFVEVVRCKDCVSWDDGYCPLCDKATCVDFYCAYGERRTE